LGREYVIASLKSAGVIMNEFVQLNKRSVLALTGSDVLSFLQGLITNDVTLLGSQPALYTALLTPQGRYLFDFFLVKGEESYFIDCMTSRAPDLVKMMGFYKLRSDVHISDVTATYTVLQCQTQSELANDSAFFPDPRHPSLGIRGIVPRDRLPDYALTPDQTPYDLHRIQVGAPEGDDLIPQKSFPFEVNLDVFNAISFNKGCYLGQELTTRTKFRGETRKRLLPCRLALRLDPEHSLILTKDEQEIGEIRSISHPLALAYVRLDTFPPGATEISVFCQNNAVVIFKPNWFTS
jgi:folate-binding protein YgfZ